MDSPISAAAPGRESGLGLARTLSGRLLEEGVHWHYEHALFLYAALSAARTWGEPELEAFVYDAAYSLVGPDGVIRGYRVEDFNLDNINPGRLLLEVRNDPGNAPETGAVSGNRAVRADHETSENNDERGRHSFCDARFDIAMETLEAQLAAQPRTASGNYWHKAVYPQQVWLDGLYMAQPFRVRRAAGRSGREALSVFDDAVAQFVSAAERTVDPYTGLLHHAWDESGSQKWADPKTGRSPNAWGRALGWYCMALVDVWECLPPDHYGRAVLSGLLSRSGSAVAPLRDRESGLWFQVLDRGPGAGNYPETSASAMFAYAFMKARRIGMSDEPFLVETARDAYRSLCARRLFRDASGALHLSGTCAVAGLGGNPYRDGSFAYYVGEPVCDDDCKGVGPFILASIEYGAAQ